MGWSCDGVQGLQAESPHLASNNQDSCRAHGPLLLKNLSKGPWEDLKFLANDEDWLERPNNGNKLLELMDTKEYYGEEKRESMLPACARLTFHLKRQRGEARVSS